MRHSMAWPLHVTPFCVSGSAVPGGDLDLRAHEVDPGDHLGHRMLDLQPRVHFEEEEARRRRQG